MAPKTDLSGVSVFAGAHKIVGIAIWRIEKFEAVRISKNKEGEFFSGDCYLVLHAMAPPRTEKFVYYWLGKDSTQDERGTLALKAIELDDVGTQGAAEQRRECQGSESENFQALFRQQGGIRYLEGGIDGGFNHVGPTEYKPRLFHIKGKRNIRAKEVELALKSLNEGDCFALDAGLELYLWAGKESNPREKSKGMDMLNRIRNDRGCEPVITMMWEDDDPKFWELLGGKGKIAAAVPDADNAPMGVPTRLFKMQEEGDPVEVKDLPRPLVRSTLEAGFVYLVLAERSAYVWISKTSPLELRKTAMKDAEAALEKMGKDKLPLANMREGAEDGAFKMLFKQFDPMVPGKFMPKQHKSKKIEVKGSTEDDLAAIANRQDDAESISSEPLPGTVKVFRVEAGKLVPVPEETYGQFYTGDCYVVEYEEDEAATLYFWQGLESFQDEKGASALLCADRDDKVWQGGAVQCRVVQGKEPTHFNELFAGKMIIHQGGFQSKFEIQKLKRAGTYGVDTEVRPGFCLYQIGGRWGKAAQAVEVDSITANLNSGDAFVCGIEEDMTGFVWMGKGASTEEEELAIDVAKILKFDCQVIEEGQETEKFWKAVGGKGPYESNPSLFDPELQPRLFQVSDATGRLKIEEIPMFSQEDLNEEDVMVLDTGIDVMAWVGNMASDNEKKGVTGVVDKYLEACGRDPTTVLFIKQEAEPPIFTCHFTPWSDEVETFEDVYAAKLKKMKAEKADQEAARDAKRREVERKRMKSLAALDPAMAAQLQKKPSKEGPADFADPETTKFQLEDLQGSDTHPSVDRNIREQYLTDADFKKLFKMDKEAFEKLPNWKKINLKKAQDLF